jgi:hypothetical protein
VWPAPSVVAVSFEATATTLGAGVATATLGRAFAEVPAGGGAAGGGAAGGGGSTADPRCPGAHEKPSVRQAGVRDEMLGYPENQATATRLPARPIPASPDAKPGKTLVLRFTEAPPLP